MMPVALITLALSSNVADLHAGQNLKMVVVTHTQFYCVFSASCNGNALPGGTGGTTTFTIPGTVGEGAFVSAMSPTEPGSVGDGRYLYTYGLNLTDVAGNVPGGCIDTIRIKLGALETFDLDGDGTSGEQVFMWPGAPDRNVPTSATREGLFVTFSLTADPVCPGDNSIGINVLASSPPIVTLVDLEGPFAGSLQIGASTPNVLGKASYKFTLLYDTIATLPPGGFIAPPSMKAGEGYRKAMLNRVNAALAFVEDDNVLPAVELLEHLLLLTDGDGDDWIQDDPETRENEQANLAGILRELIESLAGRETEVGRRR